MYVFNNFNCNLNSIKLPSDIENDDIIINLNNDNFKVSTKWLESRILDVNNYTHKNTFIDSNFWTNEDIISMYKQQSI